MSCDHTYIAISFERLNSTYVKNDPIFTPFLGRFDEFNFSLINVAPAPGDAGECPNRGDTKELHHLKMITMLPLIGFR